MNESTTYKELEGQIRLSLDDLVRQYPGQYADSVMTLTRADMLRKGVYVPTPGERMMMFALGFATVLGLGIIAWKR